jgi:hypothetical protein
VKNYICFKFFVGLHGDKTYNTILFVETRIFITAELSIRKPESYHDTENNEQIMTNNSIIYLLFLYHIEHSLAFREPNIYSLYHGNNYVQYGFLVAWAVLFQRLRLDNLEEPMNKIRALLKILVPEQDQDRWYKGASSVLYTYALVSNRHLHMRYRTEFVYHD